MAAPTPSVQELSLRKHPDKDAKGSSALTHLLLGLR